MEFDPRRHLLVHCPNCDESFPAPKSMTGGNANCPRCHRAVPVGGGYEPLFWVLVALGAVVVLVFSLFLGVTVHPIAGIAAFVIGAAAMGITIAAS
jgi:uncharacterized paraquat-inducible protein A